MLPYKKDAILIYSTTWMNLGNVMISEKERRKGGREEGRENKRIVNDI